jgi:hypothetical protein
MNQAVFGEGEGLEDIDCAPKGAYDSPRLFILSLGKLTIII